MSELPSPDSYVSTAEGARYLTKLGFAVKGNDLITLRKFNAGPAYRVFGRKILYKWEVLQKWAESITVEVNNDLG